MISRVLLACDKFKGSLSSAEVHEALSAGIRSQRPQAEIVSLPVADGGQGFISVLQAALDLKLHTVSCRDPLGRPRQALIAHSPETQSVYLESSEATGLHLLAPSERNPLHCNTEGLGDLLLAALAFEPQQIYIGLGSSATCDGALGCLSALGWRFENAEGTRLPPSPTSLARVSQIHRPDMPFPARIVLISDVQNPPLGPRGGVRVYSPQKGASPEQVTRLEEGMSNWVQVWERVTQQPWADFPGGGAAGGLGLGLAAALDAALLAGAPWLLQQLQFTDKLQQAEIVITGEGAFDASSNEGKLTGEVLNLAQQHHTRAVLVCGVIETPPQDLASYALVDDAPRAAESPELSQRALFKIGAQIAVQEM